MTPPTLSVVLATYNEAANLARCLQSIQAIANEIIVVDGSSTDTTRDIAQSFNAKVTKTSNKPNFHINKQMAISKAKSDWILQLDADEVIPQKLRTEIKSVIRSDSPQDAFWIKRQNFFLGRFLTKGGQFPDPVIRLFRRGRARLPQKDVHEQLQVDGDIGWLTTPMQHFTAPTFARYLTNANRYTSFTAAKHQQLHLPVNLASVANHLFLKPITTFFLIYFRHKGFVDGFPGFVFALFSALHHPIAFMKYWELKHA